MHRLLLAAVEQEGREMDRLFGNKELKEIAEHMNSKHRVCIFHETNKMSECATQDIDLDNHR